MNIIKFLEKIVYAGGFNLNFYNTDLAIEGLEKYAPKSFFNRRVTDIGCGDGTNTLKIKEAIKTKEISGFEISSSLVNTARKKDLKVTQANPGDKISGDLGVLWGVVHHFDNPENDMYQIVKNFNSFIIREPSNHWRIFEAGKRYPEKTMTNWVENVAKKCGKKMTKVIIKKARSVLYFIG